jgi:outer membrane lipoprotein SlyB
MRTTRLASIAGGASVAVLLAACVTTPPPVSVYVPPPVYAAPATTTVQTVPVPVGAEYGRVTNIQYFPGGVASSGPNVPGAVIGAVAGAALGNQIGSGSGRDAATVLGGAAGAAVGSQVGRTTSVTQPVYRVTVQTDAGLVRYYDVPATGDLHIGDRVRVESGVIYRS